MKSAQNGPGARFFLVAILAINSGQGGGREPSGAASSKVPTNLQPPSITEAQPRDYPGLHNVVAYHEGYYSGSVPEGDLGFETLARMGVKTVLSVDGAAPDVERAKAHGIRYIHLPIGYNGFDEQRKLQLVRATRDGLSVGPMYVHCHHGKHRSAGAAGTVIASLGWSSPEQMVERMRVSGTSAGYKGLYSGTAGATALASRVIDAVPPDFPEVSRPSGFVKGMVEVDEAFEHLKAIEKAGWMVPSDHPDLVPAAEAGRLADLLRVLAGDERVARKPADFAAMMRENNAQATALEAMLAENDRDKEKLSKQLTIIAATCKDCHVKYRD